MCGFIAVCGEKVSNEQVNGALKSLKHRGPDEYGIWQNKSQDITLGHARLSIVDLNNGLQPISNQDQTLVAVVNGEFYDHQEIHKNLENDGYKFKSSSDSEILLGLYERYGTNCLKYLRGEFAFVLYDQKNRLIFAARDRFGIKPLFYYQRSNAIYFASEVKAFKSFFPLAWDSDNFFQSINMFPLPKGTLFANVEQIPPSNYLVKSEFSSSIHLQSYWDFNYPKMNQNPVKSEQEWILGLHDVIKEAVNLRLKADVPVGCYLSGGLDSCSVLGLAQALSKEPIESFTLTFDNEVYNEKAEAEEMAKFSGSRFTPIAISQDDMAENFMNAVWYAERPIINGHGVAKYLLSREVNKAGLKVVLTGEGSDEIFGGYVHFRQDLIDESAASDQEKAAMLKELEKTNKASAALLLSKGQAINKIVKANLGFIPNWMQGFAAYGPRIHHILSEDFKNQYKDRDFIGYALNFLDMSQTEGRDRLSRSLFLWSRTMLPYYLLTVLGDRMEMAHSIEGRLPFLDHKVVEFVVNMPSNLKIKGMTEKYALREAMKPYITKTIYEREKHPFIAPPALVAKKPAMAVLVKDILRGEDFGKIPFIDQKKLVGILDNFDKLSDMEKSYCDILFMALASYAVIQKRFEL
jgi:asparagine synthase (glutamine-hydrolysing)